MGADYFLLGQTPLEKGQWMLKIKQGVTKVVSLSKKMQLLLM